MLRKEQMANLKEVIEEYAQATAVKHYMDDRGNGRDCDVADKNYEDAKKVMDDYIKSLSMEAYIEKVINIQTLTPISPVTIEQRHRTLDDYR